MKVRWRGLGCLDSPPHPGRVAFVGWHHGAEWGLSAPEQQLLLGSARGGCGGVCGVCFPPASHHLHGGYIEQLWPACACCQCWHGGALLAQDPPAFIPCFPCSPRAALSLLQTAPAQGRWWPCSSGSVQPEETVWDESCFYWTLFMDQTAVNSDPPPLFTAGTSSVLS